MSEPQRLKEKYAGTLEGAVLGSARVDGPSTGARRRTLVSLGLGAAATGLPIATTAAAGTKAAASVSLAVAMKWGTVGIAVGALTLGGIRTTPARWLHPRAARSTTLELRTHADPVAPTALPVTAAAPPESASPAPLEREVLRTSSAPRVDPVLSESRLAEEVPLLDQARQALKSHPGRALELIDDYLRRFPTGELRPEALVLRIEALVRSDRRREAEASASDYLARYPRSPHGKKIRTLMGWGDEAR